MEVPIIAEDDFFGAIRIGNLPLVKNCLIAGVSVEACGQDGQRPLGLAAKKGHKHIIEFLLSAGADPNQVSFEGKGVAPEMNHYSLSSISSIMAQCKPLSRFRGVKQ